MPIARISWGRKKSIVEDDFYDPITATEQKIKRHKTFVRYLKLTMKYMFSHVGLCVLLSLYCCLGCAIFMGIDGSEEDDRLARGREFIIKSVDGGKAELKSWLKNITRDSRCCKWYGDETKALRAELKSRLDSWHGDVSIAIVNFTYNGKSADDLKAQWNFPATLLFVVTTITAIGYGNITPKTEMSRLLLIAYALLGIPLMLMFLTNIGDVLASIIRFMYSRGCCHWCIKKRAVRHRKKPEDDIELVPNPDFKPGDDEEIKENLNVVPRKPEHEHLMMNLSSHRHIPVPVSLTACLLVLYILLGAAFFKYHEGWSYATSCYFCVVTLATIGFGDYIPGWNNFGTMEGKLLLAASAFYIVFGLSFQAMGFNLMVDELVTRAKNAGHKLGLMHQNGKKRQACNLEDYVKRQVARP